MSKIGKIVLSHVSNIRHNKDKFISSKHNNAPASQKLVGEEHIAQGDCHGHHFVHHEPDHEGSVGVVHREVEQRGTLLRLLEKKKKFFRHLQTLTTLFLHIPSIHTLVRSTLFRYLHTLEQHF